MIDCCCRYQSDIMTDRPCVSMCIDYEKVIEESSSKGKER
jgi:hypothetical protein